jgi:hypothetical protein
MGRKKGESFLGLFNNEWHNILFLYLLHHQDYAYNIAKKFKEINKDRKVLEKSKKGSLMDPSKVSVYLNEMIKAGLLLPPEKKVVKGKERSYYRIDPAVFSTKLKDDLFEEDEYFKFIVESQHDIERSIGHMEDFINYIQSISPTEEECARKIMSLGKYDALTVLTYFRELLAEMHESMAEELNMPTMSALKWLRSAGTLEFLGDIIELQIKPEDIQEFWDSFIENPKSLELMDPDRFKLPDGSYDMDLFEKSLYDAIYDGESPIHNDLLSDESERFERFVNKRVMLSWILNLIKGMENIRSFSPKAKEKRKESIKNSFLNVKKLKKILRRRTIEALCIYLSDSLSFLDDCIRFYLYKERKIKYIPLSQHFFDALF